MSHPIARVDVLAVLVAWLSATPSLVDSGGGDESNWFARCDETDQPVLPTQRGTRRRQADPVREAKRVRDAALDVLLGLADGVDYTRHPEHVRLAYDHRAIGPVVTLRRHMASVGEPVAISTAAVVEAAKRVRALRETAPIGWHLGTDRGRARDLAAACA